jgi:hypothetical protein
LSWGNDYGKGFETKRIKNGKEGEVWNDDETQSRGESKRHAGWKIWEECVGKNQKALENGSSCSNCGGLYFWGIVL